MTDSFFKQGIPFDTSDPMFVPPDPNIQASLSNGRAHPKLARSPSLTDSNQPHSLSTNFQQLPRSLSKQHRSHPSHGDSVQRIIPIDEDVRRLFEECDIAKGNSQLLNQALTYARPEDLVQNPVIRVSTSCFLDEFLLSMSRNIMVNANHLRRYLHRRSTGRLLKQSVYASFRN
jgi:hypothetical protein